MNATINTPLNNRANYDICQVCCLQYCSNTTSQSRPSNVSSDFIRKKSNIFPLIYHTDIQTLVLLGTGLKEDPCHCPFPVNCPISQTIGSQTCILHHFLQSKMMSLSLLVVENCQIVCCSSVSICIVSTYDLNTTRNIQEIMFNFQFKAAFDGGLLQIQMFLIFWRCSILGKWMVALRISSYERHRENTWTFWMMM